jgi:hypothetical protein
MMGVEIKNDGAMRPYTGHGMIEKHPAGLTIAGVMGHELGHVNQARSLALAAGESVISEDIQISVRFEGSRLIADSGKATTVTARVSNPSSSYKNIMAAFELDKTQKSNPVKPITSAAQMKEANPLQPSGADKDEETPDAKVNELSSLLSMQKQKLESKLQQLTSLGTLSRAAAPPQANTAAAPGAEGDAVSAGAENAQAFDPAAAADENIRRQASDRLMRIKQQISKIENIMASLNIVKSVKMLDGILQAVAGAGALAGGADIAAAAASQGAAGPAASLNQAAARPAGRRSASENMISMIEESLRGMMVNLSA